MPFSYRFLEDHIAERFLWKAMIASLTRWLAGFLALIACLGVFGMASLAVSRRTKEVAVRKVLGASTASVAVLLSSQSTRLVLIAVVIAMPLAYRLSEYLLRSEVNRIELDLLSYSAGGLIALGLDLAGVGISRDSSGAGESGGLAAQRVEGIMIVIVLQIASI